MAYDAAPATAEQRVSTMKSVETSKLIVRQPAKLAELSKLLETFENLSARVGERVGEDTSHDLGGAGAGAGAAGQAAAGKATARDLALRAVPTVPAVLQQRLARHIRQETRKLERMARAVSRSNAPGSAHKLNELYAKIRRLNALVREILHASIEVLKRLFVRVFIDNQPIL